MFYRIWKIIQNDLWFLNKPAYTVYGTEKYIRAEIFASGSVEAEFIAYADFLTYKSGVYQHVTGGYLHAIKIIGW